MQSYRDMRHVAPAWTHRAPKPIEAPPTPLAVSSNKRRGRPSSRLTDNEVRLLREAAASVSPRPLILSVAAILTHIGRRRLEVECQRGERVKFGPPSPVARRTAKTVVIIEGATNYGE